MESRKRIIGTSAVFGLIAALLLAGLLSLAAAPQAHAEGADAAAWEKANANSTNIKPGKTYSRSFSKDPIYIFKFTSGGGKYKIKVKGYQFLSVETGKGKNSTHQWFDCSEKGKYTFDLGKIKKGTKVTLQFTKVYKNKSDKFSFKVVGKTSKKSTKKKRIYALVYGGAWGGTPSSTTNTDIMKRAFTNLKVPGYKVAKVKKVNKGSFSRKQFDKAVKNTFKKATKNDLCLVYLNTHSEESYGVYISSGKGKGGYYKYKDLLGALGKYAKGKIILMTEVCFSGGIENAWENCKAQKRIAVLTATCSEKEAHQHTPADGDALTTWLTEVNRGAFTSALSRGLGDVPNIEKVKKNRLAADADGNKTVTLQELYDFIYNDTIVIQTGQQPQLYGSDKMKKLKLYKK